MRSCSRIAGSHAARLATRNPRNPSFARAAWISAILGATLVLAPAVADAQGRETRFLAPTDQTVTTHVEDGFGGGPPYQVIWIQNASTVPIQVYSVTLRKCENIRQSCSSSPLKLRVRPGGREVLRRVEPRDPEAGFSFRYTFGWHADSSDVAALQAMAENGVQLAQQQLAAHSAAVAEQQSTVGAHDIRLGSDDINALGTQIARLRVEPDSVVMHVGQLFPMKQVHVLAIGTHGELLGRVMAYGGRVMQGIVSMKADTVIAEHVGHTTAEFRLAPPAAPLTANLNIVVVPDTTQ